MEDILDLYEEPYDPKRPKLCMDERPCQLIDDIVAPIAMKSGKAMKYDYEYERHGTANVFLFTEPEIASVGLEEVQAAQEGRKVRTTKVPFAANARGVLQGGADAPALVTGDHDDAQGGLRRQACAPSRAFGSGRLRTGRA